MTMPILGYRHPSGLTNEPAIWRYSIWPSTASWTRRRKRHEFIVVEFRIRKRDEAFAATSIVPAQHTRLTKCIAADLQDRFTIGVIDPVHKRFIGVPQ